MNKKDFGYNTDCCCLTDREINQILMKENQELKQQLAEKDEEIKQLNNRILFSQLQAPKEQILNILGSQCIQYNPYQDKISFTVEKLVDVQKYISDNAVFVEEESFGREINDYIDNQINELKKEMKYE